MKSITRHDLGKRSIEESAFDAFGDLLTIEDLQRLTGISAQTLRAECRSGRIPSCKIGRRFFISKKAFLESVLNQSSW
ncbi:helix-turn-helix domain-containing protein [Gordonibacter urolithinfaciens]|uniref:helix-turn-helix domain-containing protein n=1 Tax=Gordonibacter urolithinfaciens TaxID=1335613 RepID=UPI003AAD7979